MVGLGRHEIGPVVGEVNDGELATGGLSLVLLADEVGEAVHVGDGLEDGGALPVEVAHTNLTEIPGMVLVHHDAMVVLAASVATAGDVLAVAANTTLTGANVTAALTVLLMAGGHFNYQSLTHTSRGSE